MTSNDSRQRGTALLISYSDLENDPRVRRQLDWLADDGWTLDTLGLGEHPASSVRDHFALQPQARWVRTRPGSILNYGVLPSRLRFRNLMLRRIPSAVLERIASGDYELIVFEDFDFLPLLRLGTVFTPASARTHIHLDLHEYRDARLPLDSIRRILGDGYYRWRRGFIGHPAITTRTTVASRIAELYHEDFGFEVPAVVRSSPAYLELAPSPLDPTRIKLLHHGLADWPRGLREMVDAMRLLDSRFELTLMLVENRNIGSELARYARDLGDRVRVIPPVPMTEVSRAVNQYDLEIMLFPPTTRNLELALPNKLFESIQGRLGLIIGESPMMTEIVREYGNGAIVEGWSAEDLARTLASLTAEDVTRFKQASDRAARELNAEAEGAVFLSVIAAAGDAERPRTTAP